MTITEQDYEEAKRIFDKKVANKEFEGVENPPKTSGEWFAREVMRRYPKGIIAGI